MGAFCALHATRRQCGSVQYQNQRPSLAVQRHVKSSEVTSPWQR